MHLKFDVYLFDRKLYKVMEVSKVFQLLRYAVDFPQRYFMNC